jgi:predicted nucleotidyltransferase
MKPSFIFEKYRQEIRAIVLSHRAANVRVFGSVLHQNDNESSDLDLLIEPTKETSIMDIGAIRHELRKLLGINVDVVTPKGLPESFREKVLNEAVNV